MDIILRTPADIGALIKDRRRAMGLDQAALAERIGVGRLWVNQIEKGKPGASLVLVLRALSAVGIEIKSSVASSKEAPIVSEVELVSPLDINEIVRRARRNDPS